MKVFNKDKALRQIKLKQNKNTYIKKVSIVLSCFILLVGIMYFTFAKFEQNSEEYTLINGKVKYGGSGDITLSYLVDGVSQSTPPAKGTGYKLKSYECTNADAVWDRKEWSFKLINMVGKVKCNLEFEKMTEITVTLYSAAEDEVYYYDSNNEKNVIGTTDSTGKLENVTLELNDYTIYSSIAKNPDNLTENYSKTIEIVEDSEIIYLMPDGDILYWYGYINERMQAATTAKGWVTHGSYSFVAPNFNTNNITMTVGGNQTSAFGTIDASTYTDATLHCISSTNTAGNVLVTSSTQKTNYSPRTDVITQATANEIKHLYATLNVEDYHIVLTSHFTFGTIINTFYAVWIEQ